MKKYHITYIAALVLLLAACNRSGQATDSAAEREAEKPNLVYWSLWNKPEPQAQALEAIMERFSQTEDGANIEGIYNGRQSLVKLRSYLAAGNTVDLFDGGGDFFLGLVTKEDFVIDLSDTAKALEAQLMSEVSSVMNVNNTQYAIPYILNVLAFFYSKQAFRDAGISQPPSTFEELLSAAQQIQKQGMDAIALEGNVGFYQTYYLTGIAQKVAGHDFLYNTIMDKSGESWDSPQFRQILEVEQRLINSGAIPPESSGYQYPAAQNNIAIGKTAMELVGSWLPTELSQTVDPGFEWGTFPFPSVENGLNENKISLAPMVIGVYKDSPNAQQAKKFIKFLLSEESQKTIAEQGKVGVPHKNVAWPSDLVDTKSILLGADGAYLSDGNLTAFLPDFTANILQPNHTKFLFGQITADEFIQTLKEETVKYWQ